MSKSITIVSALYNIGRTRWKKSGFPKDYDRYMDWVKNILSLDCNLYFYTDDHYYNHVVENRKKYDPDLSKTIIKKIDLSDLYFFQKYYVSESCLMSSPEFKSKIFFHDSADMNYPMYHIINFSKIEFVKMSSEDNKFDSTHFFWVDAGGLRENISNYENVSWPKIKDDFFSDKIVHFTHRLNFDIYPSKEIYFLSQNRNIQGTAWVVPKEMVNTFFESIDSEVNNIINQKIVGSDEKIYDFLYHQNKNNYMLKECGWFKFFNMCN
jgi:hypothetical protein